MFLHHHARIVLRQELVVIKCTCKRNDNLLIKAILLESKIYIIKQPSTLKWVADCLAAASTYRKLCTNVSVVHVSFMVLVWTYMLWDLMLLRIIELPEAFPIATLLYHINSCLEFNQSCMAQKLHSYSKLHKHILLTTVIVTVCCFLQTGKNTVDAVLDF